MGGGGGRRGGLSDENNGGRGRQAVEDMRVLGDMKGQLSTGSGEQDGATWLSGVPGPPARAHVL